MLDTAYLRTLSAQIEETHVANGGGVVVPGPSAGLVARVRELAAEAGGLGRAIELDGHSGVSKRYLARRLGEIGRMQGELRELDAKSLLASLQRSEATVRLALELWKNRRSNALEWAIVVLIVIDILIARL